MPTIVELLLAAGADPNLPTSWGAPPLLWATSNEHIDVVTLLLAAGATTNLQDVYGYTAFMWAAEYGLTDIVVLLLAAGADPNLQNNIGKSALHWAAEFGHNDVVELLLAAGADVNLRNNAGKTAAQVASDHGYQDIAQLIEAEPQDLALDAALLAAAGSADAIEMERLLAEGADPNVQGEDSWTALIIAASNGHTDIVTLLLAAGADPNLKTNVGGNAFSYTTNIEVMNLLQNAEPNPIRVDDIGLTGLMLGAISGSETVVKSFLDIDDPNAVDATGINTALRYALRMGHPKIATLLINNGADLNQANINGETALYWAIQAGENQFVDLLTRLRQQRVELNTIVRNKYNDDTPLLLAARQGNATVVEILLRAGADPNIADRQQETALMKAACNGDLTVIELLLRAGAAVSLRNSSGKTAAEIAQSRGYTNLAQLIEPAAPPQSYDPDLDEALVQAAQRSEYTEIERLLASGADPNARASDGYTALYYALPGYPRADGIAVARLLLDYGADPNLTVAYGRTTLLDMAWRGAADAAALLLEYGADPNQSNHLGFTPLFEAARGGFLAVVDILLAAGTDLNHQDNFGYTALIHAITEERQRGDWKLDFQIKRLDLAVLQRLIEAGADLNLKTNAGANAFSYAPDIEVMNLLQIAEPNPIEIDNIGLTGLMLAAIAGDEDLMRSSLGVDDPNAVDVTGINTALRYALRMGHPQIATLLLNHGADPNQANIYGETAVYWAIQVGEDQFVDQLTRLYPQQLELDTLITSGRHDTPLLLAVREGNEKIVQTLLHTGANPDLSNKFKITPLMEASGRDYTEIVNLLLEAGANPDLRDSNGRTAEDYDKYASPARGGVWVWISYGGADPD